MNLLQLRTKLVQLTGRFDLVVDTSAYADDGANFFIQAGLRLLDHLSDFGKSLVVKTVSLTIDQDSYSLTDHASIKTVQVINSEGKKTLLRQIEEWELDELALSEADNGIPCFWCISTVITSPIAGNTDAGFTDLSIKLFPPPDQAYDIEVTGRVRNKLVDDTDKNFWSIRMPETLIRAALYQIETFHRNTQGANDHLIAIQRDINELNKDLIESEIGTNSVMRDSFLFRGRGNAS